MGLIPESIVKGREAKAHFNMVLSSTSTPPYTFMHDSTSLSSRHRKYITRISAREMLTRTIFTTFRKVICGPTYTCPLPRTQICSHTHKLKRGQMIPLNNHTARRTDWKFARSIEKTLQNLTNWWTSEHREHKFCSVFDSCRHSPTDAIPIHVTSQ